MTYADGKLMKKSIVLLQVVHMSSGTLAECTNFSQNGLALPTVTLRVNSSKTIYQIHLKFQWMFLLCKPGLHRHLMVTVYCVLKHLE